MHSIEIPPTPIPIKATKETVTTDVVVVGAGIAGLKTDRDQVINTIMEFGAYRSEQRLVKLWADNCDGVMDWLLDMTEAAGTFGRLAGLNAAASTKPG